MEVKKERIKKDFDNIAKFGALEEGGVSRLAFSEEDMKAREYLKKIMEELDLEVSVDAFGNMRGKREGEHDLPPVVMGSHLDTVPQGGNYDGVVGIIGALEVIRVLNENNITTKRPIEIINFSAEESSRFGAGTVGSKVIVGKFDIDDLKKYKDKAGVSFYEELKNRGFDPDNLSSAIISPGEIYSFIEMHIEQGPVLENKGLSLGIVTSIAAPTRFKVFFRGRADHSGNTPMDMRQDALAAASELVLGVERITKYETGEQTVGTVGFLYVEPGAMNVVPGKVELGIDIRDINSKDKDKAVEVVIKLMKDIERERNVKVDYEILSHEEPVVLSDKIIKTLEETAKEKEMPYLKMHSGAGHDAMYMTNITDVGMIFIPSVDGVSHNILEYTPLKDIEMGTKLLLETILKLAQES